MDVVMTKSLRELFARTFIRGKEDRMMRTSAREFALACLEASNRVMKCPECGCWHLAKRQYICLWCDNVNDKPMFLQFKDRYSVSKNNEGREKEIHNEKAVYSFVLKDEKNDITDNYISNMYIKRDKFSKLVELYCTIRKAKDGNFYLLNPGNRELYIRKKEKNEYIPITNKSKPMMLERHDRLFFQDPEEYSKRNWINSVRQFFSDMP